MGHLKYNILTNSCLLIFCIHLSCITLSTGNDQNYNKTISISDNREIYKFYENLGNKMTAILAPILLIIGGVGNPLCIIILLKGKRKNPTVIYLCILAFFDFLVLYTGLLRQYINETWNYDIRNFSNVFCKLHIFMTYTFMQISSYILVSVTLNRFTIIFNRTVFCKQKQITSTRINEKDSNKSVYLIVFIISVLVSLWNFPFLYFYDIIQQPNKKNNYLSDCTIDKESNNEYYIFRTKYYGKLHLYIFIVVPCFILFVLNLLIIKKIMYSSKNLKLNNKEAKKKDKKRTALSIMLVSVCLWFMILKTPASLYLTFPVQEMSKPYFPLTYNLFMLVNYTNHAVNLILYIATSSSFRNEVKKFLEHIICKNKKQNSINSSMKNNAMKRLGSHEENHELVE
ncbi:unnamed protein product [Brachionus calyciflorus]|uniref:G-protein coupled receptors family 1 profile domain-containing protein n=1 Tax=Brachionus calyciflorus TaxID=104777 RepID=A0A814DHM5_9BILA|nr:unnamed protein product [Brachionus calyciflorus]